MVLGSLVGLVIGCLSGALNVYFWRSIGPRTDFLVRVNIYVGTPLVLLISIVFFAITGHFNGW
jgi:hypothetical protein